MADFWGSWELHLTAYHRPAADLTLTERDLVMQPGATGPQTVMMGGSRKRRRCTLSGWVTKDVYTVLEQDYEGFFARTATFDDGTTMTGIVEKLTGERKLGASIIWVEITIVETSASQTGNGGAVIIYKGGPELATLDLIVSTASGMTATLRPAEGSRITRI